MIFEAILSLQIYYKMSYIMSAIDALELQNLVRLHTLLLFLRNQLCILIHRYMCEVLSHVMLFFIIYVHCVHFNKSYFLAMLLAQSC